MTTEYGQSTQRSDFSEQPGVNTRVDYTLIRANLAKLTKAQLIERALRDYRAQVDFMEDVKDLRQERNDEAMERMYTERKLVKAHERIGVLEGLNTELIERAELYRGLLRTVSQAMGPRLNNAFRRGWHAYGMRLIEVREERRLREPKSWIEVAAQKCQALVDNISVAGNKAMTIVL